MTVKRYWRLFCDGCDKQAADEPFVDGVGVEHTLKQLGWTRIRKKSGFTRHLCPQCHELELGGPGNLFL